MRANLLFHLGYICFALAAVSTAHAGTVPTTQVVIDPADRGRTFEGIGAVSAGASSRLLIEYPQQQRQEVLDYLFKPNFGAAFQHLKVEIGGDVNSTDGVEPSHMHTADAEDDSRGYEWWLMEQAKQRNPAITLDTLAWGAPGWIGDGKYFSQDMADYVVKFLRAGKTVHHLDIDYTGIWNETKHDPAWIKLLRTTLDHAGLTKVGIVAADDYADGGWKIVKEMQADPALKAAVARVGVHYRNSKSPLIAQQIGCPIWSSEDGPWRGDWQGAMDLARTINRNYITGKFTKTEIWSPVTSYYDSLPLPGSGVMRANEPWSGHYQVQPAVWAVAHTTQFAQPGWRYLDSACRMIDGGSVVTLMNPQGYDLSSIIESTRATAPQEIGFEIRNLPDRPLHVWRTSRERQFEELDQIKPISGTFSVTVDPGCIYSITTTTGQLKGQSQPPAAEPLALPYRDDFTDYAVGTTPRLFSDQAGVFDVETRPDGRGKCLREILAKDGIIWPNHPDPDPETLVGDVSWKSYKLSVDAQVDPGSYVTLMSRVSVVPNNAHLPDCYYLKISALGDWELRSIRTKVGKQEWEFQTTGETGAPLARGHVTVTPNQWHHIILDANGEQITASVDGVSTASIQDATHTHGQAALGCGWAGASFANFLVEHDVAGQP
jgi:galactosylceramidase